MKHLLLAIMFCWLFNIIEIFAATETNEIAVVNVASRHFSIKNREEFRRTVSEGVLVSEPIQKHSYHLSEREFKRAEKLVCNSSEGTVEDWVKVGLAYRYGVPKIFLPKINAEALQIFLEPAKIEQNTSAIFHIVCMVADDVVTGHWDKIRSVFMAAENKAIQGNADLLTVLLEIDQQTDNPVLSPIEYKKALKRIVGLVPNARAYIALAQCTDEERFTWAVLKYYQRSLELEPGNVDALLGAGILVSNESRKGTMLPYETPSEISYFSEAYKCDPLLAGNYYGSVLYERAAITTNAAQAKEDFIVALKILEEIKSHDQDALLSLADYHATHHEAKPASFGNSFECIKSYMKYDSVDMSKVLEVLENLKSSMVRLEREHSSLFGKIIAFQDRWFPDH